MKLKYGLTGGINVTPRVAIIRRICRNLAKWTIQTVIFSLFPLILYILIHWIFQLKGDPTAHYISAIGTFTLVISSSVVIELSKEKYRDTAIKEIVFPTYLALVFIFFMIYISITLCSELEIALEPKIINHIFLALKLISGIQFVIAAMLQIIGGFYDE